MLSREFEIDTTLLVWDFIFSGIDYTKKSTQDVVDIDDMNTIFQVTKDDPFINLEFLSVGMIALIKEDLLEADFSMCLGLLMSYKEPADIMTIINKGIKVRDSILLG